MNTIDNPNSPQIYSIENVFEYSYQDHLYDICRNSFYKIGWGDTSNIEYNNVKYLYCKWNKEDIENSKIDSKIRNTKFNDLLSNKTLKNVVINLSTPGETYFEHTHIDKTVVLYYPNLRWLRQWGGETIFYSLNNKNIELVSEYEPNKLILFDGKISHTVRPGSYSSPQYRFTISCFYI
tara:strand:+ start:155 stop:691 length:537 start_codon:yes stop_codon:yes gene_type:complete